MFLSRSRGRANLRPTYICKSCLVHLLPLADATALYQIPDHESFSTTSIYHDADEKTTKGSTPNIKGPSTRRPRRRGQLVDLISHSRHTLTALKESLAAEEAASKPAPTPRKKNNSTKKEDAESFISAKAVKASVGKIVKGKKPSPSTHEKTAPAQKAKKISGLAKSPASKTTKNSAKDVAKTAYSPVEKAPVASSLPGRKPKAKRLTEAQRQMIDAVLLGAKNKRSAALSKKIKSHIRAVGENEARDMLVKIIEEGKLPHGDILNPQPLQIRKPLSKITEQELPLDNKRHSGIPRIRATFPRAPPSPAMVTFSLKEALEAHTHRLPPAKAQILARNPPRGLTRGSPRLAPTRRSRQGPSRTASRLHQEEKAVTGPLVGKAGFEVKTLDSAGLHLTPITKDQPQVPNLSYGLDRVLFNPGVYHLRDPRSQVFNFDPYLQNIMPVDEFDFNALKRYVTSSRDEALLATAKEEGKKYTGSTSSMTSALAHFHYLLSQWRPINTTSLSQDFPVEYDTFSAFQRNPAAVFLKWKDGVYAIDADKQFDTPNILSSLGKSMEKLLTLPTEDFEKYRKENSDQISLQEREAAEPFNFTAMGDFMMRSQLDAHDSRLPGTGMFDIKTRAVLSIRMDVMNYEQGRNYEIRRRYGEFESFEREYYDMIRASFLKYSLQVRMGRMDGIFVAYHNTRRIFGFQYISQPEMDLALHGTEDTTTGDAEFKLSIELLNKILDKATAKYPKKSLRLHFDTRDSKVPFMYIFAEPMEEEEIKEIQESNNEVIEEFENRVLGLSSEDADVIKESEEKLPEYRKATEWANMRAQVEETMNKDELDLEAARGLAESMIEESDIFGSEEISAEEKERLIDDLLESSAFSEVEDAEAVASREDEHSEEDGTQGASADSQVDDVEENEIFEEDNDTEEHEDYHEEIVEEAQDFEGFGQAEGEDLLVDDAPTDNLTERRARGDYGRAEGKEAEHLEHLEQTEDGGLLLEARTDTFNMEPTDSFVEGPTSNATEKFNAEAFDNPSGPPEPVESVDETQEHNPDAPDLLDASKYDSISEDKDLAPGDEALENDTQEPDSSPSTSETVSVAKSSVSAPNEAENPVTEDLVIPRRPEKDILAMTLTIRNKVNGEYVKRPNKIHSKDNWTVEYALEDVKPARAGTLYQACKARRAKTMQNFRKEDARNTQYLQNLSNLSEKGKEWREQQIKIDSEGPLKVLDLGKMKNN